MLLEITKICQTEAAALLLATQGIAQRVREAVQASRAQRAASPQAVDSDQEESTNIEDVKAYFAEHHRQQAQSQDDDTDHCVDPGGLYTLMLTCAVSNHTSRSLACLLFGRQRQPACTPV